MTIQYKTNTPLSATELAALFEKSGIHRPSNNLPRLQRMIDNANLTITAWHEEKLIGIARALTDFSYCCYLSDLAVDQNYQHQGIGRELVSQMRVITGEECNLLLLSAPEAMSYYPKLGFAAVDNGWILRRSQ